MCCPATVRVVADWEVLGFEEKARAAGFLEEEMGSAARLKVEADWVKAAVPEVGWVRDVGMPPRLASRQRFVVEERHCRAVPREVARLRGEESC